MHMIIQALVLVCFLIAPLSAKATIENLKCRAALSGIVAKDNATKEIATDYFLSNLPVSDTVRTELISTCIRFIAESYDATRQFRDAETRADWEAEYGPRDRTTDSGLTTKQAYIDVNRLNRVRTANNNISTIVKILSSVSPLYIRSEKLLEEYLRIISWNIDIEPKLDLLQYFLIANDRKVSIYLRKFPNASQDRQEADRMLTIADQLSILDRLPTSYSDQLLREISPEMLRSILERK